ncbi:MULTISPECIES: tyrosinase family protein [unclassified Streptomyces]|uniref:tyrosinase family protein n=1 Tax=unclassified Streptomyces TaxID=2593676 RepID=UPI00344BED2F
MKKLITVATFAVVSLMGTVAPAQAADGTPPAPVQEHSHISPNDPLFFVHHAFTDLLWSEWPQRNPGVS